MLGCGEDDPEQTFPPGVSRPIAKVRFLAEANRICHSTNARIEAAADDLVGRGDAPPPAEVRRIVAAVVIPALEAERQAIEALGAPAGDGRTVGVIIAATKRGIEQIRAHPLSVLDGPPPGLRRAGELARGYGAAECDLGSRYR